MKTKDLQPSHVRWSMYWWRCFEMPTAVLVIVNIGIHRLGVVQ